MFIFGHAGVVKSCAVNPTTLKAYKDVTAFEVDAPEDKTFREAWVISAGALVVDLVKAKEISHAKRRAAREVEMLPLDKEERFTRTTGGRMAEIPLAKEVILTKYDAMQIEINNAATVDELKAVVF